MLTYLSLNLFFMMLVLLRLRQSAVKLVWKRVGMLMLALCVLTAMFDSLLVGLDIVAYYPEHILGVFIGRAPVEDFFYAVLAAIIVPYFWRKYA